MKPKPIIIPGLLVPNHFPGADVEGFIEPEKSEQKPNDNSDSTEDDDERYDE